MSIPPVTDEERDIMRRVKYGTWRHETVCLKKYPVGDEKAGIMGCSAFGVIIAIGFREPINVFLRGDRPEEDFRKTAIYESVEKMFEAGWRID